MRPKFGGESGMADASCTVAPLHSLGSGSKATPLLLALGSSYFEIWKRIGGFEAEHLTVKREF